MPLTTTQPFSTLYVLSAFAFELARLPLWLLKYATSYGRQHTRFTFRQALSLRLFYSMIYHVAAVQVKTPILLLPGPEKERFVVVPKPSKEREEKYFKGPLRRDWENVRPLEVGMTWYPAPLTASAGKRANVKVIFHIHGGAYVTGDGRTQTTGYAANKLVKYTEATHVAMPQYRLSTLPVSKTSNPFPAALQDTLTVYLYLLHDLKIPAERIILSGDSAGANAGIALLRYISEYAGKDGMDLPNPRAALLWSPWISPSKDASYTKTNPNYATDYISAPFTRWGAAAFAGLGGDAVLKDPYVNSKGRPFETKVPMWVNAGSAEVLFFDATEWADMMRKAGNEVVLDVEEGVPHDVLLVGKQLGFNEEVKEMAQRAGAWLRGLEK